MSDPASLLPPNATAAEQGLDRAGGMRLQALQPRLIAQLWDPATCPISALPWLAWALSVDDWDEAWPEAAKRAVVAASVAVHRRKGTVASVRAMVAAFGVSPDEMTIEERLEGYSWAHYGITLQTPVTTQMAEAIRRALASVAPARSKLVRLSANVLLMHNGFIKRRDGTYTRGTIAFEN